MRTNSEGRLSRRPWLAALMVSALVGTVPISSAAQTPTATASAGAETAESEYRRGLALLHNFEYPRAAAAFRVAQEADPTLVMAVWGEAMTHNHPVWMEQDLAAGRAVLARLGPTREARAARARNDRERAFLDAVETLYGEGSKEERDRLYSDRMARMHERSPDDVDARAFYALSLLGLAHQGRDHVLYMRAAAILEEAYPDHRDHPGVLHYLIHAYDDPVHAPLGLRMARRYGQVAVDAPHALHMTSHIYLALGMWEETVSANAEAMRAVDALRRSRGREPGHCGHYNEWWAYGLAQLGRMEAASTLVANCLGAARAAGAPQPAAGTIDRRDLTSWSSMAVRHAIETGAAPATGGLDLNASEAQPARFNLAYWQALTARDADAARQARERLEGHLRGVDLSDAHRAVRQRLEIIVGQAGALALLRAGQAEAGLAELRRIAETERGLPAEFGPPLVEKPSFELLGDELLRLGRRDEAAQAYRESLALAPGRRLSRLGLERSSGR